MITFYKPKLEDLYFKELMLNDPLTMSFNHAYGGTISFPKDRWEKWYQNWIDVDKRFYRYIINEDHKYVGEISYHYDDSFKLYLMDIIIYYPYRGRGYSIEGLNLLFVEAKNHGINVLYDNIAIDNPAYKLFIKMGFIEEYRNDEFIMMKKML